MPSNQLTFGRNASFGPANGISSAFSWWSDPIDSDDSDSLSISLSALSEIPVAMLVVPSATAQGSGGIPTGDGLLYVAQTPGATPGNAITVAHSAPSGTPLQLLNGAVGTGGGTFNGLMNPAPVAGTIQVLDAGNVIGQDDGQGGFSNIPAGTQITGGQINYTTGGYTLSLTATAGHAITLKWVPAGATVANPYTVSTNAITGAPWVGATNAQMAILANQKTVVTALAKAFVWGWGAVGSPVNSLNSLLGKAAENDLLVTQISASFVGGSATAAQTGVATLECCADLSTWNQFAGGPNDVTSGNLVGPGTGLELHVDSLPVRYWRVHWAMNVGSVGQISGIVGLKGGAR